MLYVCRRDIREGETYCDGGIHVALVPCRELAGSEAVKLKGKSTCHAHEKCQLRSGRRSAVILANWWKCLPISRQDVRDLTAAMLLFPWRPCLLQPIVRSAISITNRSQSVHPIYVMGCERTAGRLDLTQDPALVAIEEAWQED